MNILLKLILREAWYHRSRISLAVIATMAMSCMLVWLVGSIGLIVLQYEQDGEHYLGNFHAAAIPTRGEREVNVPPMMPAPGAQPFAPLFVDQKTIDELKKNELVQQVSPARQIRNTMAKWTDEESVLARQRAGLGTPMGSPTIISIDTFGTPFEMESGQWFADDSKADEPAMEGVIGTTSAKSLGSWGERQDPVKVGDYVAVRIADAAEGGGKEFKIKIVGLVEQKLGSAFGRPGGGEVNPAVGSMFVSPKTAERIKPLTDDEKGKPQYLYVRLRDGANVKQFKEEWTKHLLAENVKMKFIDADDIQAVFDNQRRSSRSGGLMGAAGTTNAVIVFSTLVSILIVFTALSMGVSERSRVFAMLRTVGASRWQIAVLIFGESVILCALGWVGGLIAGWFVLQLSVWLNPVIYGTGKMVSLSMSAVSTAGIAALIGSMLAAVIPAWRGASIQPLEGMNRSYIQLFKAKWFVLAGVCGLLLMTINPVICYYEPLTQSGAVRTSLYMWLGLPTQLIGLLLLTLPVVVITEKLFVPLFAALFCVRKELLANQLSSNLWRTVGTAIALCIGLGVYSFLEITGYSMLVPFTHSDKLPNTLVTFLPKGLELSDIDTVKQINGVDSERFLPIALEQPLFAQEQADKFAANGMSEMQARAGIIVFGLDVKKAFDKPQNGEPLVGVQFTEGTLQEALKKLETGGRYCIVPDSFAFRAGLHIGDMVEMQPVNHFAGRRGMGGGRPPMNADGRPPRAAGQKQEPIKYEIAGVVSVPGWLWMAKLSGIRKYGYRSGAMMFAPYETVQKDFNLKDASYFWFDRTLDADGKPIVADSALEAVLQDLADEKINGGKKEGVNRPMVKVSSHDYLNERVGSRADQVIQAGARLPLILLAISSLGMMGTIAASIRVRRFEIGVLRSLGVTRWGLIRMILAEALLICTTAIILSLAFGIFGGWCFVGLMRYVSAFGGFVNPLTIPWYYLSIGLTVAVVLCLLAAVFPAITAGRKEPAALVKM